VPRVRLPLALAASLLPAVADTRVTFTLDRAASVRFTVLRRSSRRGRAVTTPLRGSFTVRGKPGPDALRFSGRLAGAALPSGRYALVATPAGGAGARASFRVR